MVLPVSAYSKDAARDSRLPAVFHFEPAVNKDISLSCVADCRHVPRCPRLRSVFSLLGDIHVDHPSSFNDVQRLEDTQGEPARCVGNGVDVLVDRMDSLNDVVCVLDDVPFFVTLNSAISSCSSSAPEGSLFISVRVLEKDSTTKTPRVRQLETPCLFTLEILYMRTRWTALRLWLSMLQTMTVFLVLALGLKFRDFVEQ